MAGSVFKGADGFIAEQRPVLRVVAYAAISVMALIDAGMVGGSWSRTRFMQASGAFLGTVGVASASATMVAGGVLAAAGVASRRAQTQGTTAGPIWRRLASDRTERTVCCAMAAWWLAVALCASNAAFVFRAEISRCVQRKAPARMRVPGVSADAAAAACAAFRGSLALAWMICAAWAARAWRALARDASPFDSRLLSETQSPPMDLGALKPVSAYLVNPETFSPREPRDPRAARLQPPDSDYDLPSVPAARFVLGPAHPCRCPGCPAGQRGAAGAAGGGHGPPGLQSRPISQAVGHLANNTYAATTRGPQVVGTATLETEPVPDAAQAPAAEPQG
ncbi:hypothetical protein H4R18_005203 [Coemansia javaensis]|uniref:Uncharacterized protein n=1 Tax=Coemansia javaensis TaxID=2761396 RepID=A0A9W8H9X5_9FUNG|nr:hypothetical protein H4R18_005203 [Coemansia javaensis]